MSEPAPEAPQPPQERARRLCPSVAERFSAFQRAGGLVVPLVTALLAFFIGGLVVLVTTATTRSSTYQAIFNGTGLIWFFHPGSYTSASRSRTRLVWFPWTRTASSRATRTHLQQTLISTTTLILTGLAVAFAFRCGLFNIGGQGQYIAGSLAAVWVGSSLREPAAVPARLLAIAAAALAGALSPGSPGS